MSKYNHNGVWALTYEFWRDPPQNFGGTFLIHNNEQTQGCTARKCQSRNSNTLALKSVFLPARQYFHGRWRYSLGYMAGWDPSAGDNDDE